MVIFGCDHAGFKYKSKLIEFLQKRGIAVKDMGAMIEDPQDSYVDYAKSACEEFLTREKDEKVFIILVCGSGVGMSIVANKFKGVRAVNPTSTKVARLAREHNNANCLCLGARTISLMRAKGIVKVFLETDFLGGKHEKRVNSIE